MPLALYPTSFDVYTFHHHSILLFSLDFSDLYIFPVYVSLCRFLVLGVLWEFGVWLLSLCLLFKFAVGLYRFKRLTEFLWGFPDYRNQSYLLIFKHIYYSSELTTLHTPSHPSSCPPCERRLSLKGPREGVVG